MFCIVTRKCFQFWDFIRGVNFTADLGNSSVGGGKEGGKGICWKLFRKISIFF